MHRWWIAGRRFWRIHPCGGIDFVAYQHTYIHPILRTPISFCLCRQISSFRTSCISPLQEKPCGFTHPFAPNGCKSTSTLCLDVRTHYRKIMGDDSLSTGTGNAFHKILPQRNEFSSWSKLILQHTQCGQDRKALRIYTEMRKERLTPKRHTFIAVLKACSRLADLQAGKEIHSDVIECGSQSDIYVTTTLVDMYVKCGSMVDARRVFEKMPHRDVVSWNAMINGFAQEEGWSALQLYARMQHEGLTPDSRTFVAALKACSRLAEQEGKQADGKLMKIGRAIHSQVAKSGLQSDVFVATTLVDMYAKCRSMVDACHVFERMPYRNLVSWTAMIMGYAQIEKGELALQYYARLRHEGLRLDALIFVAALKACGILAKEEEGKQVDGDVIKIRCLEKGRIIHSQAAKSGFEVHIYVASALVDMYSKCGSMMDARHVFEKMPYRNVVLWNAMIMGYAQMEKGGLALQLYNRMQHEGFTPDACTFLAALKACSGLGSLETGKELHAEICRVGLEGDAFVANCLIDMYGKCGSMIDAQRWFDALPAPDVVRWNALIAGYSSQGDCEHVFDLFERMQQEGTQPDGITFISVLTVCNHGGLVGRGQKYFQIMCLKYGISPASEHYNCMIDLLGRAGKLDEAVAMVKNMPFKCGNLVWMSILGSCRKWNNMVVGKHAFACAVSLDGKHTAAYVLMRNIYASAQVSEESAKIRVLKTNA